MGYRKLRLPFLCAVAAVSFLIFGGVALSASGPGNFSVWGSFNPLTNAESEKTLFPKEAEYVGHSTNRTKDPALSYEGKKYIIFFPNYLERVYRDTVPRKELTEAGVSVFAAKGEYEPFTFAVHGLDNLQVVQIKADDFTGADGKVLRKENIEVRVVKTLYKKFVADYPNETGRFKKMRYSLFPLVLERRKSVNIGRNETAQFWGTVYVPNDTAAGSYSGSVHLLFDNGKEARVEIRLKVYPFALVTPDVTFGLFYSMASADPLYVENIGKEFRDIREHGINSLALMSVPVVTAGHSFDFTQDMGGESVGLKTLIDNYRAAGFTGPVNYSFLINRLVKDPSDGWKKLSLGSDELDELFKRLVQEIIAKKAEGWPVFLFGADEPSGVKKQPSKHFLQLLRKIPGARTIAELNGLVHGFDDIDYFDSLLDVECIQRKAQGMSAVIRRQIQRNKDFCVYNSGSMGRNPLVDRYAFGFDLWKLGAKTIYQWNYHRGSDFTYKDSGGKWHNPEKGKESSVRRTYTSQAYSYPAPDGPVPSAAWEGLREGIDDARYLSTLMDYIQKASAKRTDSARRAVEKTKAMLDNIFSPMPVEFADREKYLHQLEADPKRLDGLRQKIAEEIISLSQVLSRPDK